MRRVFCNRSLRLDQIEWVGFDMDYTLAIYDQPKMDQLTIDAALQKLIARATPRACARWTSSSTSRFAGCCSTPSSAT